MSRIQAIYNGLVKTGAIKEVPEDIANKLREKFVEFFSRYDKRLPKINREKIHASFSGTDTVCLTCCWYGKAYGKSYKL